MNTDPIADLLTRIRNASRVGRSELLCPASALKQRLLDVLKSEGFISDYKAQKSAAGFPELRIMLNRDLGELNLKRISKPGRRVYVARKDIPRVLNGFGIAILSTPKGVMANKQAHREGVGGELLCEVW